MTQLFHSLQVADADAMIEFLTAVGFTESLVVRHPEDSAVVEHAQFCWRDSGGVMFGSAGRREEGSGFLESTGHAQCYLVVAEDGDLEGIHRAALANGGTSVETPREMDYGGRGCSVRDREGNQWSFGTYAGE